MTQDHDQTHSHSHNQSQDNCHDHGHSHEHSHANIGKHVHNTTHVHTHYNADALTLEQKLQTLLGHWIDHNDSHKNTFFTWAQRAKDQKINGVAKNLEVAGQLSTQVTAQLKEALKHFDK